MKSEFYKRLLKTLWISLLSVSYGIFTYNYFYGWWYSSIGTILILFFGYLFYRSNFRKALGLMISWKALIISLLVTALTITGAYFLMQHLGFKHIAIIQPTNIKNYYHIAFYTLNEEIIMGAILIYILKEKMKFKSIHIAIGLALFFSVIHFVFYKWIFIFRCNIHFIALTTLFFVGVLRNILILSTGHIGYSWGLHFGWMLIMFGFYHYFYDTQMGLTEPERFNIYLGSYEMLGISILLALSGWFFTRKRLKQPSIPQE